ncbi:riboflavin kinase [Cylindrobasidium torrendii FP15055 ss-10]|uniref:Riboflavin kinase n=1 Tax=Cylindrobasidium torrendii FP15055 ss-10 TaxID=1314674 RepID=A0A0D7B5F1_9AGAR|nr:riboflavin kinase [Cylindrobasidium torrendii FP15055 ss-10]
MAVAPNQQTVAEITSSPTIRPPALFQTESYRQSRPLIVGPDVPHTPYPIPLSGSVQKGFGRGGKDLGCPTANLPDESIERLVELCKPGVYYGYAQVPGAPGQDGKVYPMAMSLGWNPFYKNERLTAEIHIMHKYENDFYGKELKAIVLGYIRPELDYTSREALIADIDTDKQVAIRSLERPGYKVFEDDAHFTQ